MAKGNIYTFKITKSEKKKVETTRKNKETGEEETVLSNRTVKTPVDFLVKRPTRRLADEAEVYYSQQLSKAIKMGIVTKAMLLKKYADNGGALSEEESKELVKMLKRKKDLEDEYKMISASSKDKAKKEKIEKEIILINKELIEMESALQGVYQHTADQKAERATLLWYIINLTRVKNEDGEFIEFFEGSDYEDKLEDLYDKDESEDEFYLEAISKLSKAVSYWFYAQEASQEDIEKFINTDEQNEEA